MPELFDDMREVPEVRAVRPSERSFDWGPPATDSSDSIKEYALYIMIGLLIGLVGWFLVDTGPDMPRAAGEKSAEQGDDMELPADAEPGSDEEPPPPQAQVKVTPGEVVPIVAKPQFHVQLGAFGDEETARATIEALQKHGHVATFSAPDDQYEMYRVLMGPFLQETEAESLAHKLNELDFPCFVIESAHIQSREEE